MEFYMKFSRNKKGFVYFMLIISIILVLLTHKPADMMTNKIIDEKDSFNSYVIVNILCNVFLMSIFLTVIGTWIGTMHISMDQIKKFFFIWPRNFAVSFGVELLITQPIARFVMLKMHEYKYSKKEEN